MLMDGRESVVGQSEALAYSRPTPVDTFIRTLYTYLETSAVECYQVAVGPASVVCLARVVARHRNGPFLERIICQTERHTGKLAD